MFVTELMARLDTEFLTIFTRMSRLKISGKPNRSSPSYVLIFAKILNNYKNQIQSISGMNFCCT